MNPDPTSSGKAAAQASRGSKSLVFAQASLGVAMAGAGYLAWGAITHGPLAGCGTGSGCSQVLQSRWAYWLEVPVSVPALVAYAALLAGITVARKRTSADDERGVWAAIIALAVIVVGAALWFVGLQALVIKAFCPFCMVVHACGSAAAVLCLSHIPLAADPQTPMWTSGSDKRGVPRRAAFLLAAIGLGGVAVLAGGQVFVQKQRNVVRVLPAKGGEAAKVAALALSPNASNSNLAPPGGQATNRPASPNARLIAPGLLSLYEQFRIRLDAVPMIGSPGASNVIVYLFDYTCPHCRDLHGILTAAQNQLSNQLGVVCLPMPMSTNCNPLIPSHFHANSNACDYARLGLAVWLAKPGAQRQFDDWFFAPQKPVPVEQAKAYAAQLVGADKLEAALADPWLQQQILTDCALHFANWQATGQPVMPQLILGEAVSLGPLNSVEHLLVLLNRYLGMDTGVNKF